MKLELTTTDLVGQSTSSYATEISKMIGRLRHLSCITDSAMTYRYVSSSLVCGRILTIYKLIMFLQLTSSWFQFIALIWNHMKENIQLQLVFGYCYSVTGTG